MYRIYPIVPVEMTLHIPPERRTFTNSAHDLKKECQVIDMPDNLHQTYDIELFSVPIRVSRPPHARTTTLPTQMPQSEWNRICSCVARCDADVFCQRVNGEHVSTKTCEALFQCRASSPIHQ